MNVLPYSLGIALGADWDSSPPVFGLSGNLSTQEARGLVLSAVIGQFELVRLAFAWAQTDAVPIILGQMNFFLTFEVCFYRTQEFFEVEL